MSRIGSHSSAEIGAAIFEQLHKRLKEKGLYLAAQCCEHLNRALVIEKEAACKYGYERVNVVPQLKAGGSFGTAAYAGLEHPVMVEEVRARAGIDIGDTLIGISIRQYGTDAKVSEICELNQIANPDDIKVGEKILLP